MQQKISDVEVKEREIFDWRKKVTEAECKLKQQENLLESVVSERNLYSKNLVKAQVGRWSADHHFLNILAVILWKFTRIYLIGYDDKVVKLVSKSSTSSSVISGFSFFHFPSFHDFATGGDRRNEEEDEDYEKPGRPTERRDHWQGADPRQGSTGTQASGEG